MAEIQPVRFQKLGRGYKIIGGIHDIFKALPPSFAIIHNFNATLRGGFQRSSQIGDFGVQEHDFRSCGQIFQLFI